MNGIPSVLGERYMRAGFACSITPYYSCDMDKYSLGIFASLSNKNTADFYFKRLLGMGN